MNHSRIKNNKYHILLRYTLIVPVILKVHVRNLTMPSAYSNLKEEGMKDKSSLLKLQIMCIADIWKILFCSDLAIESFSGFSSLEDWQPCWLGLLVWIKCPTCQKGNLKSLCSPHVECQLPACLQESAGLPSFRKIF